MSEFINCQQPLFSTELFLLFIFLELFLNENKYTLNFSIFLT